MQEYDEPFAKWVRTKDQLERGIKILQNTVKKGSVTKEEIESKLILAAVAIECSVNLQESSSARIKKSMRYALWNWMIDHYCFVCVPIAENEKNQLSQTWQEHIISENHGDEFVVNSCSYTRNASEEDEKVMNKIFLKQFKAKWKENKERLHQMCQKDLGLVCVANAEPKNIKSTSNFRAGRGTKDRSEIPATAYDGTYKIASLANESKDVKGFTHRENNVDTKEIDGKSASPDFFKPMPPTRTLTLTHDAYGVTRASFQKYLGFGIQYFVQLEKQIAEAEAQAIAENKKEKETEAKRAHAKWVDLKQKLRSEKFKEEAEAMRKKKEMEETQARIELDRIRFFGRGDQRDETASSPMRRIPSPPKPPCRPCLMAIEATDEENCISLQWNADEDVDSFTISVYNDLDSESPMLRWQDPENSNGHQNFILQKYFFIHPGERYVFGASCNSENGTSAETRIEVISKPSTPEVPIVKSASEKFLEFGFEEGDKTADFTDERYDTTILPRTGDRQQFYVVESCHGEASNDEDWHRIWKGTLNGTTRAVIGGLMDNSSYRMRIQRWSDDHCSSYGKIFLSHTMLRNSTKPHQIAGTNSSTTVTLGWDAPRPWGNSTKRTGEYNNAMEPAFVLVREYIEKIDDGSRGQFYLSNLGKALKLLNVDISEDECLLLKKEIEKKCGNNITITQFMDLWSSFVVTRIFFKEVDRHSCIEELIHVGGSNRIKIEGLSPNKSYSFAIQHINLRGRSKLSTPLVITTLPEKPSFLHAIHSSNSELILKVIINRLASFDRVNVAIREKASRTQWVTAFTGKSLIIKIPSLRPGKIYEIKCSLLNVENKEGGSIYRTMQTAESRLIFDHKTLLNLFTVDCVDLVEGDLIFFTELAPSQKPHLHTREFESSSCTALPYDDEMSIVSRVLATSSLNSGDERIKLEVGWASTKQIAVGTILERNQSDLWRFEVLRAVWIDEEHRLSDPSLARPKTCHNYKT